MQSVIALLLVCDRFAALRGISEARVSTILFNDGKRIKRIRDGSDIGARNAARALEKLSSLWPAGEDWPLDVLRPVIVPENAP